MCAGQAGAPRHVAIIMDGNGRWAAARHLPRIAGHREGARAVRRTIEAAIRQGVSWLTIYAFSSENWRRPVGEVFDLTGLLRHYLRTEIAELGANGVRLRFIGDRTPLRCRHPASIWQERRAGDGGEHAAEPDGGTVVWRAGRDRRRGAGDGGGGAGRRAATRTGPTTRCSPASCRPPGCRIPIC